MARSEKGVALVAAIVFTLVLTILGLSVLIVASNEIILTRKAANKAKAFYLAEAGLDILAAKLNRGESGNIEETPLGDGTFHVECYPDADPPYAVSTGIVGGQVKRIKVDVSFEALLTNYILIMIYLIQKAISVLQQNMLKYCVHVIIFGNQTRSRKEVI